MAAAAAPVIMNVDQQQQQLPEGYQMCYVPQMVPMCFVGSPEFCQGMWVPPLGGYEAMGPQGAYRGPNQPRYNGGKANSGAAPAAPNNLYGGGALWMEQAPLPSCPQSPDEPLAIELSSLPKMLCNKNCLEAAIEQAGLEVDVLEVEVQDNKRGKAVLLLSSERAAQRCIRHFHGLRWAKSSEPVTARYHPEVSTYFPSQQQRQASQEAPEAPVAVVEAVAERKVIKASGTSPKIKPCASPASTYCPSPSSTFCPSPASTFCKSPMHNSSRPRWADLDSDDEDDDESKSTLAGNSDEARDASDSGDSSNTEN